MLMSHASQSMTWPVTLAPSSSSIIATMYGFCRLSSSRPSWTSVKENTLPSPFSFTRSILPMLFLWPTGQIALGGKKCLPQLLHLMPTMLYLLSFSLQNLGAVAISSPPEKVHDHCRARAADVMRQADSRVLHLSLVRLAPELSHDLDSLCQSGGADRISPGLKAACG